MSRDLQEVTVSFFIFIRARSYFCRVTRECGKNVQELQNIVNPCEEVLDNDEDLQSQSDEDESDFNSAVSDTQTYELLDNVLRVLDDILLQHGPN